MYLSTLLYLLNLPWALALEPSPEAEEVGVALAQRVVELHGGSIKAEINGIKGATIRFTLPYSTH